MAQSDDGTCPLDYKYNCMVNDSVEGMKALGCDVRCMKEKEQLLTHTGFINITKKQWKIPIGPWPREQKLKEIGSLYRSILVSDPDGMDRVLIDEMEWKKEEVDKFLDEVRKSLMDTSIHTYHKFVTVYGQKPQKKPCNSIFASLFPGHHSGH